MKILFVLLGPTAVGKTTLSLRIARHLVCPIISADSRQIYKEMPIGSDAPTEKIRTQVEHFFVASQAITNYYSASLFEEEALSVINELHETHEHLLLCGGSMLYIDAVCKGIDDMPTVTKDIRDAIWKQYHELGLDSLLEELKESDLLHYEEVDRKNHRRVIHALEVCRMTEKPYSSFRTRKVKIRPFKICKIGLTRDRMQLYERINTRVDEMIDNGFVEEASNLFPMRQLNALNTLGYKELFAYLNHTCTLPEAVEKIKCNTRTYARKQMTWFKRDTEINWFNPDNEDDIIAYIDAVRNESK